MGFEEELYLFDLPLTTGTPPNLDESLIGAEAAEMTVVDALVGFVLGDTFVPTDVAARAFCCSTVLSEPADFCIIAPN